MECVIRSLKLNYVVIGEGIPVVIIHGFAVDHRLMKECMEPIFKDINNYKRIYIDLPGMGHSESNDKINCSDDILDIICEFIDTIIPKEEFILVGESYGGYLSRGVIHKNPELVKGLVLICPTILPNRENRTLPNHQIMESDTDFIETLPVDIKEKFSKNNVILNERVYSRYLNEIVVGIKLADKKLVHRVRKNFSFSFDVDSNMTFSNPALIIVGRQDSVVGYIDAFNILESYPRANYILVDGAGHNLQIEKSVFFTDITIGWFKNFLV